METQTIADDFYILNLKLNRLYILVSLHVIFMTKSVLLSQILQ